jgi:hypothetical protein
MYCMSLSGEKKGSKRLKTWKRAVEHKICRFLEKFLDTWILTAMFLALSPFVKLRSLGQM